MENIKSKAQRPCDNCRRRKIKCLFSSDEAVNCVLCVSRSTQCTYIETAPRKKQPVSPKDEKVLSPSGSRPKKRQRVQSSDDDNVLTNYANLPNQSLLKQTLGHQNRQTSTVIGATSEFVPFLADSQIWNEKGECSISNTAETLRRASRRAFFMIRPDTQVEMDAELANLDMIENFVAPHGPELVNLYFRIVHPSFPILHKKVFLEKHGRSYRELTPCGLGAVYIMALNWWSYSPTLASLQKPDAQELEDRVLKMLFEVHRRPKISDLQGGLVLMQRPDINSWAMTGHLVSMAQNLGINADCSDWRVPDWERGVRKRVAWALFMQDKWGALIYGRGSHIKPDDWDVKSLEPSDFPETAKDDDDEEGSAEIEKGKQTFLQMVALTEIVAEILDQFFTLKAVSKQQDLYEVLEKAKPLQLKLKSWHSKIPATLSLEETAPRKLSSVGYLHLAYYTAEITLHRAILRSHTVPNVDPYLYSVTRLAATTRFTSALSFVKRLRAEHFQSFWYFSSTLSFAIIGLFAGILCATLRDNEEEERRSYLSTLLEYRWVLRVSANSAGFLNSAVGMLDARNQLLQEQFGQGAARSTAPRQEATPSQITQQGDDQEEDQGEEVEGDVGHYGRIPSTVDFFSFAGEAGTDWQQSRANDSPYFDPEWEDLNSYHADYPSQFASGTEVAD